MLKAVGAENLVAGLDDIKEEVQTLEAGLKEVLGDGDGDEVWVRMFQI